MSRIIKLALSSVLGALAVNHAPHRLLDGRGAAGRAVELDVHIRIGFQRHRNAIGV